MPIVYPQCFYCRNYYRGDLRNGGNPSKPRIIITAMIAMPMPKIQVSAGIGGPGGVGGTYPSSSCADTVAALPKIRVPSMVRAKMADTNFNFSDLNISPPVFPFFPPLNRLRTLRYLTSGLETSADAANLPPPAPNRQQQDGDYRYGVTELVRLESPPTYLPTLVDLEDRVGR